MDEEEYYEVYADEIDTYGDYSVDVSTGKNIDTFIEESCERIENVY